MTVEEALVIIESVLAPVQLNKLQKTIFQQAWAGQPYFKIARDFGYGEDYVKGMGAELWQLLSQALGQKVSKSSLQSALLHYAHRTRDRETQPLQPQSVQPESEQKTGTRLLAAPASIAPASIASASIASAYWDWNEAVDVSIFYGRRQELATLQQWLVQERCRLVAVLGMGGIGKTALVARLGAQIQGKFDCVVWRSLRDAPLVEDLVSGLIRFLSQQQESTLPSSLDSLISLLVSHLNQQRCLVILDNAESILREGERAGQYREGFAGYGTLIRRIGESPHQSCMLLTSREKPKEICLLKRQSGPVRALRLVGLEGADGQKILQSEGILGTEAEQQELLNRYAGNPLAVKIAATTIQELFCGNLSQFLEQGVGIFGDICDLLDQHFDRLSEPGKMLLYWLAINRESVTLPELRSDIISAMTPQRLLETLESLERRSLLERSSAGFTLQNVVMEYISNRLMEQIEQELRTGQINLFDRHALIKATAKDHVRNTQIRLFLQPLINRLTEANIQLATLLSTLRNPSKQVTGYAAGNLLNLLGCCHQELRDYDFSDLTIRQAYLRGKTLYQLNFTRCHFVNLVLTHEFGVVSSVAFSPDGTVLATADSSGEIRLWQAATGHYWATCQGHTNWARVIAFSPDGHLLASGSDDQTIRLWDVQTQRCLYTLQGHINWIWTVAFSPDGCLLASGSDDQTIRLWDLQSQQCLHIFQDSLDWVQAVAFSPDGQQLVSAGAQTIQLWDLKTRQCLHRFQGHTQPVRSIGFSPDGQTLVSGSEDQTVRLWDVKTQRCLHCCQGHSGWVWSVGFSPDGETIASASDDQTIRLWSVTTGQCLHILQGHSNRIWAVAFNPNGSSLSSSSDDQTVRLWDLKNRQCMQILQGHMNRVLTVAFHPNGQTIASGGDQSIQLWDLQSQQCVYTLRGHTSRIWAVAFSPDGQLLASGSEDQTIRLWDLQSRQCLRVLHGHSSWVWSVAFSPDGQIIASSSEDQTIKLWDRQTGQCLTTLRGHDNWVLAVDFSPDGQLLVSGGEDQTIRVWDLHSGDCVQRFQGHSKQVWSVAFSPNGETIASGSDDQTIRLWSLKQRRCLHVFEGHRDRICAIAFSPDGQMLVSGSDDQTVRVWDLNSYRCRHLLQGHTNPIGSIAFSPDSQTLVSGSTDGTLRLWQSQTGKCQFTLSPPKPYEGTKIAHATGLTDAQRASLIALGATE